MSKKTDPDTPEPENVTAALGYEKNFGAPTPVKPGDKAPRLKDWSNRILSEEEIRSEFRPGDNVGILLGEPSDGLVDIDVDCPIARHLAPEFLPPTERISGREGAPGSHYYYVVTDEIPTREGFADPIPDDPDGDDGSRKAMIVEIRGTGHQTVVPPSIHPSGEKIQWESEGPPAQISNAALRASVAHLAVSCLLVRHYPKETERHLAFLPFAGMLLRGGVSEDDVRRIVEAAARYDGDEDWEDRVRCVEDTAETIQNGEPTTGSPTLTDYMDPKVVDAIRKFLKLESDTNTLMDEINKNHAVVTVGGKTVILREYTDPVSGISKVEFLRRPDFELLYCNRFVLIGNRKRTLGNYWLHHSKRRKFDRVVFEPGVEIAGCFNLWRGFAVTPRKGDWSRFRGHIREVICGGDERLFSYVMAWMADAVQNPRRRPGVVIALRGKQGTGKGLLWREFGALFEPHYVHITHQHHFTGRFNALMEGCLFMFVDEAYWAGDKINLGYVKSLITDPELIIERKGKDAFQLHNYIRIGIASNEDWFVPVGLDDRRFCVIDVSDAYANDREYFGPIYAEMENGGREAMLYDLLRYDLSKIDLGDIPKTAARLEQQLLSADPVVRWWYEVLDQGYIVFHASPYRELNEQYSYEPGAELEQGYRWPGKVPTDALYQEFLHYCCSMHIRHPDSRASFAKQFKELCPSARKIRMSSKYVLPDSDGHGATTSLPTRPWGYKLLDLGRVRADFVASTGMSVEWGEDAPAKPRRAKRKRAKKS